MPDPRLFAQGISVAGSVAVAFLIALSLPWREPTRAGVAFVARIGVGLAFVLGCAAMSVQPHWPPREDLDRFLLLLVPAVVVVETIAPLLPPYAAWGLRVLLAAAAGPVLLYDTIYLAELAGPGSRAWSATQIVLILGGLAAALLLVWTALILLARRPAGRTVPLGLALACGGAGAAVMLSGYFTGGQIGVPLAAALAYFGLAVLVVQEMSDVDAAVAVGVLGLFALLVIGRFFGTLSTMHVVLLFAAPLLGWLPELIDAHWMRPWMRSVMQVALVAIPVVFVVGEARQKFAVDSKPGVSAGEPSVDDYLDYGK